MVVVGEVPVVFFTVFVVAEDSVGGADGDEAVRGVWIIAVAVGVVGFAQLEIASGVVLNYGFRLGVYGWIYFLISARVACCGRPKVS